MGRRVPGTGNCQRVDNFGTNVPVEGERRKPIAAWRVARTSKVMGNCSGTVRGDERWSTGIRSEGNPAPEVRLAFVMTMEFR